MNPKATLLALTILCSSMLSAAGWQAPPAAAESAAKLDGLIAWTRSDGIYVSEPGGVGWTKLVDVDYATSLSWSPDGQRLVWGDLHQTGIYVADADGSHLVKVTADDGAFHEKPAWAPDGDQIVWSKDGDIWVVDADGGNAAPVVTGPEWSSSPAWSADGTRIAWEQPALACNPDCVDSEPGIFLANADGSDVAKLPGTGSEDSYFMWSPTEDLIAWRRRGDDGAAAVVAETDGTVVRSFAPAGAPLWSPDGESLLWAGAHIADLASGEVREVADGAGGSAAWAPSGSEVVVVQRRGDDRLGLTVVSAVDGVTEERWFTGPEWRSSLAWQPVDRIHRCRGIQATIIGTPGDDVLTGGVGNDVIVGLGGDDRIAARSGVDTACGGAGADEVRTGSSPVTPHYWADEDLDVADGGSGDDLVVGGSGHNKLFGGPGDDRLRGFGGIDLLYGGGGNDRLEGNGMYDDLFGGGGRDVLVGGAGGDRLWGGRGPDLLKGGRGDDWLYGRAGADVLRGGSGPDTMYGERGRDRLYADDGRDYMWGGTGKDRLWGGRGSDDMYGGANHDRCDGGNGDNHVRSCEVAVSAHPFP